MRVKLLVAGVLSGLLTTGGAAFAKAPPADGPRPLPVAEATALAATGVSSGSVTRSVSAEEALAAASGPGATVSVAPGLSLREAVGLGSAGATPGTSPSATAAEMAAPTGGPSGTTTGSPTANSSDRRKSTSSGPVRSS